MRRNLQMMSGVGYSLSPSEGMAELWVTKRLAQMFSQY